MANNTNMVNKLPAIFQTVTERKFFDATFDQVFSKKNSERTTGYIGRRIAGEFDPINDFYLPEPDKGRTWYQLEPTAVSRDSETLEKTNRYFYEDLIDRLRFYGGNVGNHDRLFDSRYYSYAPPIDVDKFVNYQNYYWVPNRLPVITLTGYTDVLINDTIIGAKTYNTSQNENALPADVEFTNGMRVIFANTSYDYEITIEGVGDEILLTTDVSALLSVNEYRYLPWDNSIRADNIELTNGPWDSISWDAVDTSAFEADYITMERGSVDMNAWSRSNKWYHIDLIGQVSAITGTPFPINTTRALRPILEFERDLELYKSGTHFVDFVTYFMQEEVFGECTQGDSELFNQVQGVSFSDVRQIPGLESITTGETILFPCDDSRSFIPTLPWDPCNDEDNLPCEGGSVSDGWDSISYDGILLDDEDGDPIPASKFVWKVTIIEFEDKATVELLPYSPDPVEDKTADAVIEHGDIVIVSGGQTPINGGHKGLTYYYDVDNWRLTDNRKTNNNQAIEFALYDTEFDSIGDNIKYPGNNFNGSEIFSYKLDSDPDAIVDSVLGLPIMYRSLGQLSDIVFTNDLQTESYNYVISNSLMPIDGYYYFRKIDDESEFSNSWYPAEDVSKQRVLDRFTVFDTEQTDYFLSVMPYNDDIIVTLNGEEVDNYTVVNREESKINEVVLRFTNSSFEQDDVIEARSYTHELLDEEERGYFEIPQQLEANPTNEEIGEQSYGDFVPHFTSIMGGQDAFEGNELGFNNFRDTAKDPSKGSYILQNDSPLLKTMLTSSEDDLDAVKATRFAGNEYTNFKAKFLKVARQLDVRGFDPLQSVDDIKIDLWLEEIFNILTISKEFSKSFAYSYMLSRTDLFSVESRFVSDVNDTWTLFPGDTVFVDLADPRNVAYLYNVKDDNGDDIIDDAILLVADVDYTIDLETATITWIEGPNIKNNDTVVARIYEDTLPAYLPATPAKLGMAPVSIPALEIDSTKANGVTSVLLEDQGTGYDPLLGPTTAVAVDEFGHEVEASFNVRIDTDPVYIPVVDEFGNQVYEPMYDSTKPVLDENGYRVIDENGKPLFNQKKDENGNLVYDETRPVYETLKDDNGNDVHLYQIQGIDIIESGHDYYHAPDIVITGPGTGATAISQIDGPLVIVGHDGSRSPVFGNYITDGTPENDSVINQRLIPVEPSVTDIRDNVLFELEKRIYNGIDQKFTYNETVLPIAKIRPGVFRSEDLNRYSREEYFKITESFFSRWTAENKADYRLNEFYDFGNWRTWNYSSQQYTMYEGTEDEFVVDLPGHWKGIFTYFYDTIRPDTHPWEMLGYTIKPTDWSFDPIVDYDEMWEYIASGGGNEMYARTTLIEEDLIPVDRQNVIRPVSEIFGIPLDTDLDGNLVDPPFHGASDPWMYGDGSPVEAAWYDSAEYKFSETEFFYLMRPAEYGEQFWDPANAISLQTGTPENDYQLLDEQTNERLKDNTQTVHAENVDGVIAYRSGYQQYISDRILFLNKNIATTFGDKVRNLNVNLGHKMAAFTDKDTISVRLSSVSTESDTGNLIVPTTNYDVNLHTSSSVKDYVYSGVMIRTNEDGTFRVYGYDLLDQTFKVLPADPSGRATQVSQGGTPASFRDFEFSERYLAGEYVRYQGRFYQCKITHTASSFVSTNWTRLGALPEVGGVSVTYRPDRLAEPELVPYSSVLKDTQEVYDFLIGYGAWLESEGWSFENINNLNQVEDWKHAGNQFLFWVVNDWQPDNVLLLSPGSTSVSLEVETGYPMNVERMSNGVYSIMGKLGFAIDPKDTTIHRDDKNITIVPTDTGTGVYYCRVSSAETEHVLMFDNITEFNDTIYSPLLRVRQDRLKFSGTRTLDWFGKMEAGGYLIQNDSLIQNFENLTSSITEYYNTETALDEPEVDLATKHLVGYENKSYLDELEISDDVQFNFYQGYIREKGSLNSVSKLLRSNAIQDKEDISFFEEWAFKLQDFAGSEENVTIEFVSSFDDVVGDPQSYRLNYTRSKTGYVKDIVLFNVEKLYDTAPDIKLIGDNIEEATAIAILGDDKKIASIDILNPGSGYTEAPTVLIDNNEDSVDKAYTIFQANILQDDKRDSIIDIDIDDSDKWLLRPSTEMVLPMTDVIDYQIPNAGYVHKDDVDFLAFDTDAVFALWDNDIVPQESETIWVAKNSQEDWGVYEVHDNGAVSNLRSGADDHALINVKNEVMVFSDSVLNMNRRYLDTKYSYNSSSITLNSGLVKIRHEVIGENDEVVSTNDAIYPYVIPDNASPDIYVLTDRDGNYVKYSEEFAEYDDTELPLKVIVSFTMFYNLRFGTREERTEAGLLPITNLSWIDDVESKWSVEYADNVQVRQQDSLLNTDLFENAFIRDPIDGTTSVRLPVYDPFKGIIAGPADQNVDYKSSRDPARYTNSNDPRLVNPSNVFDADQVGMLWWDLSDIRYLYYEQPGNDTTTLEYRRDNWGKIFPGSSADIYEWVESSRTPKQYSGTGTPRSETDYVKVEKYNKSLDANVVKYYFWVKDTTEITTNRPNRTLTAFEVSRYIASPKSMGYAWFTPAQYVDDIPGSASFTIANSDTQLSNTNSVIQVNYRTRDAATDTSTQWQLLREGDRFSVIPDEYWDKMVDSLVGYTDVLPNDEIYNNGIPHRNGFVLAIPDQNLSDSEQHGIGIRPQQTMFVDIFAARKIMYQVVNDLLSDMKLWTSQFDFWDNETSSSIYWDYVDWYEEGFDSSNTVAKRQVGDRDDLNAVRDDLFDGELVRVYPFVPTEQDRYEVYSYDADTDEYLLVRRQQGTIELNKTIYTDTYSIVLRDEIREILTALKDNVFVDEYVVNENLLFFAMVNYSFSEQRNIDWAFKTTYISFLQDNVLLSQRPNYEADVLDEFLSYVNEVKPYHTKLRDTITVLTSTADLADGTAYDDAIGNFACEPLLNPFEDPVYPGEMVTESCRWVDESITENLRKFAITIDFSRVWCSEEEKLMYDIELAYRTSVDDYCEDRPVIDADGFVDSTRESSTNELVGYERDGTSLYQKGEGVIHDISISNGWDFEAWDIDGELEWDLILPIENLVTYYIESDWIPPNEPTPQPNDDTELDASEFNNPDNVPEELVPANATESVVINVGYESAVKEELSDALWDFEAWDTESWDGDPSDVDPEEPEEYLTSAAYRINITPMGWSEYTRISNYDSTVLAKTVEQDSMAIEVTDASKLPLPTQGLPGAVWIDSERIEYKRVRGNTLLDISRGTLGTTSVIHAKNARVFDGSMAQVIPDAETAPIDEIEDYFFGEPVDVYIEYGNESEVFEGTIVPIIFDPWFKKEVDPETGDYYRDETGNIILFENSPQAEFILARNGSFEK